MRALERVRRSGRPILKRSGYTLQCGAGGPRPKLPDVSWYAKLCRADGDQLTRQAPLPKGAAQSPMIIEAMSPIQGGQGDIGGRCV